MNGVCVCVCVCVAVGGVRGSCVWGGQVRKQVLVLPRRSSMSTRSCELAGFLGISDPYPVAVENGWSWSDCDEH